MVTYRHHGGGASTVSSRSFPTHNPLSAVSASTVSFRLFPIHSPLPAQYHLATIQEVRDNRQALFVAMPSWEIANLADGSVDGAAYGGHTRMEMRNDVGHKLATGVDNLGRLVEQDIVDIDYEESYEEHEEE